MQCALERSSDFQKVPDKGKKLLEVRLQENNCSRRFKVYNLEDFILFGFGLHRILCLTSFFSGF